MVVEVEGEEVEEDEEEEEEEKRRRRKVIFETESDYGSIDSRLWVGRFQTYR